MFQITIEIKNYWKLFRDMQQAISYNKLQVLILSFLKRVTDLHMTNFVETLYSTSARKRKKP